MIHFAHEGHDHSEIPADVTVVTNEPIAYILIGVSAVLVLAGFIYAYYALRK